MPKVKFVFAFPVLRVVSSNSLMSNFDVTQHFAAKRSLQQDCHNSIWSHFEVERDWRQRSQGERVSSLFYHCRVSSRYLTLFAPVCSSGASHTGKFCGKRPNVDVHAEKNPGYCRRIFLRKNMLMEHTEWQTVPLNFSWNDSKTPDWEANKIHWVGATMWKVWLIHLVWNVVGKTHMIQHCHEWSYVYVSTQNCRICL